MDIQTARRSLQATTALLLVGTAGAAAWSCWSLQNLGSVNSTQVDLRDPPAIASGQRAGHPPHDAAQITRSLRAPLYDPPPRVVPIPRVAVKPKPVPVVPPPARLEMSLVGTIIELRESLAIITDAAGDFDIKGIGQTLELEPQGVVIEQIEADQVTLQHQGRSTTLLLDRNFTGSSARGKNRKRDR